MTGRSSYRMVYSLTQRAVLAAAGPGDERRTGPRVNTGRPPTDEELAVRRHHLSYVTFNLRS
ncbi:hypothetical protein [Micromonospora coerulea]|uniref:hypothetical protein n=1 Tax=Micromonospora coerulea TaxID=47856 RepID=UPI0019080C2B|nr:hypothetical protein [Micromonospora veneta]